MAQAKKKLLDEAAERLKVERLLAAHKRFHRLEYYTPTATQRAFHDVGATKRERCLMACNRGGKSYAAAAEVAMHARGVYPDWWTGKRFMHPVHVWCAGETADNVRNIAQQLLCGPVGSERDFGTGFIAREWFEGKPSKSHGIADAYDTIRVKHLTGGVEDGISTIGFKTYAMGWDKFQGETLHLGWVDEDPNDEKLYTEFWTRMATTGGHLLSTLTPLKGSTPLVIRFMEKPNINCAVFHQNLYDPQINWMTKQEKDELVAGYPEHLRRAKVDGYPSLGSGLVFPYARHTITEPALTYVPEHWPAIWGIDFGIGHPFAAALLLWDRDTDTIHVHAAFKMEDALPPAHARRIKMIGGNVPVAWPQDGTAREKGSGIAIKTYYEREGLIMLPEHAHFLEGGYSTEAGVLGLSNYMKDGRFFVAEHLRDWFEEYENYHRDDNNQIHKVRDDIMSATRIGFMQLRSARIAILGQGERRKRDDRHDEMLMQKPYDPWGAAGGDEWFNF